MTTVERDDTYGEMSTAKIIEFALITNNAEDDEFDSFYSVFKSRAEARKIPIESGEAEALIARAVVSERAEVSPFRELIRVRVAVRHLIATSLLSPTQVRNCFLALAYVIGEGEHRLLAETAVNCGIRDGLEDRVARAADGS